MPEHPAELPAEGEGGSGRVDLGRIRGGIGGPNELPPFLTQVSVAQLVNEVFRLRNRVHSLESNILAARMSAGGARLFGGGGGILLSVAGVSGRRGRAKAQCPG